MKLTGQSLWEVSLTVERKVRHYDLLCKRCQRVWHTTYELVAYHDADGDHECFYRYGAPVSPPWARPACPSCGGLRVALLPGSASVPDGMVGAHKLR
jgi:hypothetical protein